MWINEGLRRGWPPALEWLYSALKQGSAGYVRNERKGRKYLQLTADLGVPLAQYELGLYYGHKLNPMKEGEFICPRRQAGLCFNA